MRITGCLFFVGRTSRKKGTVMDARKVVIEPSIDQSKDPKDYGAKVSYEGMECEVRKLENPLARRYNALQHIVGDLQDILGFIEKYNSSEVLIRSAIFQAIIISYGRCFGSGDARGISLREQDVFPEGSPLLQTHRDLIRIRHKVVAHADDPDVTCGEISIVFAATWHAWIEPCASRCYSQHRLLHT
mgnify:CR=1 FL=1